jgi:hypothetical protein
VIPNSKTHYPKYTIILNRYWWIRKFHLILGCSLILFLIVTSISCGNETYGEGNQGYKANSDTAVLFVGNSLTYSNSLPQLFQKFAQQKGKHVAVEILALPNYALVDHLADGNVQKLIASGKYNYVVVQQGPSSQQEGRALLLEAASVFEKLCKDNGARLAFFMVWPAYANYSTFPGVIQNYTDAATLTGAILCPVGTAWKSYIDSSKDLSYYSDDYFHPSVKGSEKAAQVIFESIYK